MDALPECLEYACLLRRKTVLHAIHRRRFAAVRLAHPIGESRGLAEVLACDCADWVVR